MPSLLSLFSFIKKLLFIYLAVSGLNCSKRNLVPWWGAERRPPAMGAWSLTTGTQGKSCLISMLLFYLLFCCEEKQSRLKGEDSQCFKVVNMADLFITGMEIFKRPFSCVFINDYTEISLFSLLLFLPAMSK